jgi:hypothetical protein
MLPLSIRVDQSLAWLSWAINHVQETVTIWSGLTATPQWVTANITDNVTHKTKKD